MTAFGEPTTFTVGTVGPPGQRVFYLQAGDATETVSVKMEKQQVMALAEYLGGLLADLPADGEVTTAADLVDPGYPDWVVGNIGVAYDIDADRIVVVAEELVPEDERGEILRVAASRAQVKALIDRAEILISGGRPPCRLCGAPIDPDGHACPRAN